jgi:L-rhamnose mutarotase
MLEGGNLLDKAGVKKMYQQEYNDATAEVKAEWDAEFKEAGFSSFGAYLDAMLKVWFASITYNYSFSEDEKALFLDEPLPNGNGADAVREKR